MDAAKAALCVPAEKESVRFAPKAITAIVEQTQS
jgi:hypothetical protein